MAQRDHRAWLGTQKGDKGEYRTREETIGKRSSMTQATIRITTGSTRVGKLIPLGGEHAEILARWRDENAQWFLTSFAIDTERTRLWLENVAASEDRTLFGVEPEGQDIVGVVGLTDMDRASSSAELDHVLRGRDSAPGIMRLAIESLLAWASRSGYSKIRLRVFQDNPALPFYEGIGFVQQGSPQPLREVNDGSARRWVESTDAEAERYLIAMVLPQEQLRSISSRHTDALAP